MSDSFLLCLTELVALRMCVPCSIVKNHAVIVNTGGEFEIKPGSPGAKIKVNGNPVTGSHALENKDRILFGKYVPTHSSVSPYP